MSAQELQQGRVLFVDDEKHLRNSTAQAFDLADMDAQCFAEADEALSRVDRKFNGVVVSDIRMPTMSGMELMQKVREIDPDLPVILVTGHADVQLAVEAMREGAYDFIEKPFAATNLIDVTRRALEKRRLVLQVRQLQDRSINRDELGVMLAGRSRVMETLRDRIRTIAQSEIDVLLVGETGTGKDVAARAIHRLSNRKDRPFVAINCAALPAEQIESELFGHEVGAFPGAVRSRYGKFEHARHGTILLDNIDSMPMPLQAKLLQVLQDRSISRLGSNETIDLDVRFLAASRVDLQQEVDAGRFRSDLYYRLNVVTLEMPELSRRREDVALLFHQFAAETAHRMSRPVRDIPAETLQRISSRDWPGNVRELKHAAERFTLGLELAETGEEGESNVSLAARMMRHERAILEEVLQANGGSLKDTYETLSISRKSLYEKMQRHGLAREDYQDK